MYNIANQTETIYEETTQGRYLHNNNQTDRQTGRQTDRNTDTHRHTHSYLVVVVPFVKVLGMFWGQYPLLPFHSVQYTNTSSEQHIEYTISLYSKQHVY